MDDEKEKLFILPSINFNTEKSKFPEAQKCDSHIECGSEYDALKFCRTCANSGSSLVPIFQEEGVKYDLSKKIDQYLPIEVSEEDDLPLQLCYHCASTLIAWETLVRGCIDAEKKLLSLKASYRHLKNHKELESNEFLISNNESEDEVLLNKKDIDYVTKLDEKLNHEEKKDGHQTCSSLEVKRKNLRSYIELEGKKENTGTDQIFNDSDKDKQIPDIEENYEDDLKLLPEAWLSVISCKQCGKICCASKHLRQHERRGTCFRSFQCAICNQLFTKELNYNRHLKKHQTEKSGTEVKRFSCGVCNKKFKFEDNGLAHEKVCGRNKSVYKCAVCGKRFETKDLADQHWTSHHKSCVCHMCGQYFGKPESLKQHVKTIHDDFKLVCHYCGKKFTRKARLQEHLQHHTGRMDFTCHVCGKGSTNAYSFGVHLATHSQETPYTCSFCPRTFKHMKYVYLHERSVHLKLKSGKTYVKPKKPGKNMAQRTCPCCSKTFKRESAMLIHKRSVHEGKNGYICKLCGKDFKYTYLLYVHKKKHHFPELCKYVCEYCDKPFPVKTELQSHLRKHTGEKPYVCGLCGKSYSFHGSLNMHMKTQHENKKTFKCTLCSSSYNFQSHLSRHMSVHAKLPFQSPPFLKDDLTPESNI